MSEWEQPAEGSEVSQHARWEGMEGFSVLEHGVPPGGSGSGGGGGVVMVKNLRSQA